MYSLVVLTTFIGVALANPLGAITGVPLTSTDYLKKIFPESGSVGSSLPCAATTAIVDTLHTLGLQEASKIAVDVGLEQMLVDSGFSSATIFVSTDAALQALMQEVPEISSDVHALTELVKAWIVDGAIMSSAITDEKVADSLQGAKLRFNVYDKAEKIMTVNGARIVHSDISASNAIIHVIDKAIYPLPQGDVFKTLSKVESFSMLVELLKKAELMDAISTKDPITLFAPTNAAIDLLPSGALVDLKANTTKLQEVLMYHVIADCEYSAGLSDGQRIMALRGGAIQFNIENGVFVINKQMAQAAQAHVVKADIPADNGVIHVVDHVLTPMQSRYILV